MTSLATDSAVSLRQPLPAEALRGLSAECAAAVQRLAAAPSAEPIDLRGRTHAAVALILYESDRIWDGSRDGFGAGASSSAPDTAGAAAGSLRLPAPELQVLMTTRALHLRSHPGQASLPGGKVDAGDGGSVERAALRESDEEVGLGSRRLLGKSLFWLHTAEPFISKTCLLVHPVFFLLTDPSRVLPSLRASPSEVSELWSLPLSLFLSSTLSAAHAHALPLADPASVDTHRAPQVALRTYSDVPWIHGQPYRLHRFRTHRQLVKGLTADILIDAAVKAAAGGQDDKGKGKGSSPLRFELTAPGQPPRAQWVAHILARGREARTTRWGDGESGDLLASAHKYETVLGVDFPGMDEEGEHGSEADGGIEAHGLRTQIPPAAADPRQHRKEDLTDGTEATLLQQA